ncbi:hypothetical protein H6G35_33940 [Aulosira sp. FACHB-113]|uniref:hypothetical protein n=1 Tax=Tolypothrix tenuis TaxID=457083 RepID=UPI0016824D18|nr:hypothetical protein [Aulosira sp. FACHB-113]
MSNLLSTQQYFQVSYLSQDLVQARMKISILPSAYCLIFNTPFTPGFGTNLAMKICLSHAPYPIPHAQNRCEYVIANRAGLNLDAHQLRTEQNR